jgi:predicted branched-subunit amino acid permease
MQRPFRSGAIAALGLPALAMATTFLAFGAAVREAGLPLSWAVAASLLIYGMAGQLVLLQVVAGAGPGAAVLGATVANGRFLPMSMAIAPLLGPSRARAWWAVPFIAITPWAAAMRALPDLPATARLPWFLGFGLASWLAAGLATAAGHGLAGHVTGVLRAALLFTNPLYFALLLAAGIKHPPSRQAVLGGVVAAPLALWLPASWGLLAAGVAGGTLAFLWGRRHG